MPSIPDEYMLSISIILSGFKPYYNWNTFNTTGVESENKVIKYGFKPCYKWNTFNTKINTCNFTIDFKLF